MGDLTITFLIILVMVDLLMIAGFVFFYLKFKKVFDLPWEEIKESIERAQELVKKLEKLQKASKPLAEGRSKDRSVKDQVFYLSERGLSPKEIAKQLKISEAEVEVILSSKKLR
ncbi:response regulator transcription factor [Thermodesulfobacterium thermophilum]|uniref:response regulator transcription factor n=1 Tax=Thermodesulfobacterium thermophilum TaxID=886 RepID=UPI0003B5F0B7|nr:response regulator transcription factor [Thermodesulfobacterium thermophilum]